MVETAVLRENYSGVVRLRLRVEGREHELARTGPGYVEFRDPVELPPCRGELITIIDDREHCWPVDLPNGANGSMSLVPAVQC